MQFRWSGRSCVPGLPCESHLIGGGTAEVAGQNCCFRALCPCEKSCHTPHEGCLLPPIRRSNLPARRPDSVGSTDLATAVPNPVPPGLGSRSEGRESL